MKHEDDLLNHRTTWLLVIQGFLFATLGVIGEWPFTRGVPDNLQLEREWLVYILAGVAILIAIAALISIWAANDAIDSLHKKWVRIRDNYDEAAWELLPELAGGGNDTAKQRGKTPARAIPMIVVIAWIAIAIMAAIDRKNMKTNETTPAASLQAKPLDVRECSEPVSANVTITKVQLIDQIVCSQDNVDTFRKQLQDRFGMRVAVVRSLAPGIYPRVKPMPSK